MLQVILTASAFLEILFLTFVTRYDNEGFPSSTDTISFDAEGSKVNPSNFDYAIYFNAEGSIKIIIKLFCRLIWR